MLRPKRLMSTARMAPTPESRNTGATASWMTWETVEMLETVSMANPLKESREIQKLAWRLRLSLRVLRIRCQGYYAVFRPAALHLVRQAPASVDEEIRNEVLRSRLDGVFLQIRHPTGCQQRIVIVEVAAVRTRPNEDDLRHRHRNQSGRMSLGLRTDGDLDIAIEKRQEPQQALGRAPAQLVVLEFGDMRLRNAEQHRYLRLREAMLRNQIIQPHRELNPQLALTRIREAQVDEHIARPRFNCFTFFSHNAPRSPHAPLSGAHVSTRHPFGPCAPPKGISSESSAARRPLSRNAPCKPAEVSFAHFGVAWARPCALPECRRCR